VTSDLVKQFLSVKAMTDTQARGRAFEDLIVSLFQAHHFEATKNPRAAAPRQTDLIARTTSETYLIECKWRSAPAGLDELDGLRARLGRTPGAIGILISMSGFAGSAISELSSNRRPSILLVSGGEIEKIVHNISTLPRLLWSKTQALMVDGIALVDEPPPNRKARKRPLPPSRSRFVSPGSDAHPVLQGGGGFGPYTFTHDLVDIDWVAVEGAGVTLEIRLPRLDEDGVLGLVERLRDLGWASRDARWNIQQSTTNWHGFGTAEFATELRKWQQRSRTTGAHHTEEFCYLDKCDGGFYTLTGNIVADKYRCAMLVELTFQLQGVPLDAGPLLHLCRSLGAHDPTYFRPLTTRSVNKFRDYGWSPKGPVVEPVALVVTSSDSGHPHPEWVTGIVIENLLYGERSWHEANDHGAVTLPLSESRILVCGLRQHHPLDQRKYAYRMESIEFTRAGTGHVVRPIADWEYADTIDEKTDQDPAPNID
jgi:hypothetical protein